MKRRNLFTKTSPEAIFMEDFLFFDWNLNFYFIGTKSHWKTNRLLKWKILIQALKIMFGQDPDWSHFFGNNFHFLSSWVRLRCWKALCTLQLSSLRTLPKTTTHYFDLHSEFDRQPNSGGPWGLRGSCSLEGFVTQKVQQFKRNNFGLLEVFFLCKS